MPKGVSMSYMHFFTQALPPKVAPPAQQVAPPAGKPCVCFHVSMEALFAVLLFYLVSIFGKTATPHKTKNKC